MTAFENWPDDILVGHHHIVKRGTFSRVAGGGELVAGQVVSEVDGKWYKLARETAETSQQPEKVADGTTDFDASAAGAFLLPHGHIIPGTLKIAATKAISDNKYGILKDPDGTEVGTINYNTGVGAIRSAQAGLGVAEYRRGDPDGKSIPCGILVGPITLSATAEVGGAILRWGEYARRLCVFAGNTPQDEIDRMLALLEEKGFFQAK